MRGPSSRTDSRRPPPRIITFLSQFFLPISGGGGPVPPSHAQRSPGIRRSSSDLRRRDLRGVPLHQPRRTPPGPPRPAPSLRWDQKPAASADIRGPMGVRGARRSRAAPGRRRRPSGAWGRLRDPAAEFQWPMAKDAARLREGRIGPAGGEGGGGARKGERQRQPGNDNYERRRGTRMREESRPRRQMIPLSLSAVFTSPRSVSIL